MFPSTNKLTAPLLSQYELSRPLKRIKLEETSLGQDDAIGNNKNDALCLSLGYDTILVICTILPKGFIFDILMQSPLSNLNSLDK